MRLSRSAVIISAIAIGAVTTTASLSLARTAPDEAGSGPWRLRVFGAPPPSDRTLAVSRSIDPTDPWTGSTEPNLNASSWHRPRGVDADPWGGIDSTSFDDPPVVPRGSEGFHRQRAIDTDNPWAITPVRPSIDKSLPWTDALRRTNTETSAVATRR